MNRRDFTRGLATFGLAPLLPVPRLSAGTAGAVGAVATAEKMYFMGWYTARLNKTCSLDLLKRELNVDTDVAGEVFQMLVKNNTISAPDALGVSKTIDPLSDSYRRATGKLARQIKVERTKAKPSEKLVHAEEREAEDLALDKEAIDDHAPGALDTSEEQQGADRMEASALEAETRQEDHQS